jgi:hypothetical protein
VLHGYTIGGGALQTKAVDEFVNARAAEPTQQPRFYVRVHEQQDTGAMQPHSRPYQVVDARGGQPTGQTQSQKSTPAMMLRDL